jgi:endo-1,3-1,4-beta-glycanase ExoK
MTPRLAPLLGLLVLWGCGSAPVSNPFGASGGAPGGETGGAAGHPPSDPQPAEGPAGAATGTFELAWEDPFDAVDLTRWELMTHTWDGNLAQFSAENAAVSDGVLSLSLTAADDPAKPFRGVEMRSRETLTYGKVEASMKFAPGSAVVSSLVLIYTPWPPDDWNELDIEFLGKNTDRVQFNHMINIPPADPATGHLQFPELRTLDFNPAEDFHTYAIEWVPGEARFLVDGVLLYTATEEMARMVLPQNILMTIWASDSSGWAGPVDTTTAPTRAQYDWLRVYRYVQP